jgi:hypothetical protein
MPRGLSKIQKNAAEAAQRQADFDAGGGYGRAFMIKNGQTARVRCLEEGEGVWYVYVHDLPKKPGQQYADRILCPDQALTDEEAAEAAATTYIEGTRRCYAHELDGVGCSSRVVINMIRFDEPKIVRDAKGKTVKDAAGNFQFDGVEPALVTWHTSQQVGGRLAYLESIHGPLTRHVLSIYKTGDKNNAWMIDVVEPNKAPTDLERKLLAKKISPPKAIQNVSPKYMSLPLMSYGDMKRAYSGVGVPAGFDNAAPTADGQPPERNIYAEAAAEGGGGQGHLNLGAFQT